MNSMSPLRVEPNIYIYTVPVFDTISTLCIMQEKNYKFIMTIYCDSVGS